METFHEIPKKKSIKVGAKKDELDHEKEIKIGNDCCEMLNELLDEFAEILTSERCKSM